MNKTSLLAALAAGLFLLQGCGQGPKVEEETAIASVASAQGIHIRHNRPDNVCKHQRTSRRIPPPVKT